MTDGSIFFESGTNLPETAAKIFEAGQQIVATFEKINAAKVSPATGEATAGLRKMLSEYEQIGAQLGREIEKIRAQASQQIAHPSAAGVPQGDVLAKMNQAGKAAADKMLSQFARDIEQAPSALKGTSVMAQVMSEVAKEFDQFVRQQAGEARRAIQDAARTQGVQPAAVLGAGRLNYPKVNQQLGQQLGQLANAANPAMTSAEFSQMSAAAKTTASEVSKQASIQRQLTSALQRQLDGVSKAAQAAQAAPLAATSPLLRAQRDYGRGARDAEYRKPLMAGLTPPALPGEPGYLPFNPANPRANRGIDRRFDADFHRAVQEYKTQQLQQEQDVQLAQQAARRARGATGPGTPEQVSYDNKRNKVLRQFDAGFLAPEDYADEMSQLGLRPPSPAKPMGPKEYRETRVKAEQDRLALLRGQQSKPDTTEQAVYEANRARIVKDLNDQQYTRQGFEESLAKIGDRPGTRAAGEARGFYMRQQRVPGIENGPRRTPQSYGLGEHIYGGRPIAGVPHDLDPDEFIKSLRTMRAGGFEADNNYDGVKYSDAEAMRYKDMLFRQPHEMGFKQGPEFVDVPIKQMVGFQQWVDSAHVDKLAQIPAEEFQGADTPNVYRLPPGEHGGTEEAPRYLLRDGYHRTAAATLRGEDTIRVRVAGAYGRYPTSDEIGDIRARAEQEHVDRGYSLADLRPASAGPRSIGYFAPGGGAGVPVIPSPPVPPSRSPGMYGISAGISAAEREQDAHLQAMIAKFGAGSSISTPTSLGQLSGGLGQSELDRLLGKAPRGMGYFAPGGAGGVPDSESTGRALSDGISEGLHSGSALSTASEYAQRLLDEMNDSFGIASPSKKTEKMGQELMAGLALGMRERIEQLRTEAEKVAEVVEEAIRPKPERYRDPVTGKFAKRPTGPARDPKTGRFVKAGGAGGGAGEPPAPPALPDPSEPAPRRYPSFEAVGRGQGHAGQRVAGSLYDRDTLPPEGYELPDFLRAQPNPRIPPPAAPLDAPMPWDADYQRRVAGPFAGRPGGPRFTPTYTPADFLLGPKPGPGDPDYPRPPADTPGRLAEPSTYVDQINKAGTGAYDQAQAEAAARALAAKQADQQRVQDEADAARRRVQVGNAQVATGTATRAGGFTFGPDGSVITSAGKLVTEYGQLRQATDALTASVERQVRATHEANVESGKTPLNQFYKGFLGAGGRKRHGGAQDVDEENPLNGLFETAGVVAKYEILGRGLQSLVGFGVEAVKQFAELDRSTRELNEQLGEGQHVSNAYVSSLEDIATAAGGSVTEAMDSARRGIAAFSDQADSASTRRQAGSNVATAASQNAVVTGQGIDDSTSDLIAIGKSYELTASQLGDVTNAVANAKESFGSDSDQVQKALAELGDVGKEAGYSLEQLAQVIGLIQSKTGESGSAIASTLTRVFSTLSNGSTSADLAKTLGIDLTGSVQQKVEQLASAFPKLTVAERQQLEATVGGAKGLRDLIPLLQGQPALQAAYTKALSDTTAGQREYQAIIGSLSGQIKVFGATIKTLALDIARTGILDPLILGFELLKPAVKILDDIVRVFDNMPDPIKHTVALLLEAVVALNAIKAASAAGLATTGIGKLLGGGRQVAGTLLGNPFRGTAGEGSLGRGVAGPLRLGVVGATESTQVALANVRRAEQEGDIAIGKAAAHTAEVIAAGGDDIAIAQAKAAEEIAVASKSNALLIANGELAASSRALDVETRAAAKARAEAGAREIKTVDSVILSLREFGAELRRGGLASGFGGSAEKSPIRRGIRRGIGAEAVRDAEGNVLTPATGLYGGVLREGGKVARLGKLRGLGATTSVESIGEAGAGLTVGAIALTGGAIAGGIYEEIHALSVQATAAKAASKAAEQATNAYASGSTDAIRSGADALIAAADQGDKARHGVAAFVDRNILSPFTGGEKVTKTDTEFDRIAASIDKGVADKLDELNSTNAGAFDFTKPTGVEDGLKLLAQNGLTARQQMDALNKALEETAKSGTAAAGSLNEYELSRLPSLAGGKAAATLTDLINTGTQDGKGNYFTGSSYSYSANEELKKQLQGKNADTGHTRFQDYTDAYTQGIADLKDKLGIKPGEKLTKAQAEGLTAGAAQLSVDAAKQAGITLSDDPTKRAIQIKDLENAGRAGAAQAFNSQAFGAGQKIAKADIPAAIAAAQQLSAQANQDAATNASLGLGPDGRKLTTKPPTRDRFNASSRGDDLPGRRDQQDTAAYQKALKQYQNDQRAQQNIEHDGAAVTGDKEQINELNRLRANLVKSGATKQQLAEFDQQYAAVRLKLQQDTIANLQSLESIAEAGASEFDKSGRIQIQLQYLDQEIKKSTDPQAKRALQVQKLNDINSLADQNIEDQANELLATYAAADTTGQAQGAAQNAVDKLNDIIKRGGNAGAIAAQRIAVGQASLAAEQATQGDITTAANNRLGTGDSLGEQRNAAAALYRQSQDLVLDPTALQQQRDRRAGASAYADYRIASNQAYGALAASRLDPRDALANDAQQRATDRRALQRVKPGDIAGRAAAQAALRDLALKTAQDQLDAANSVRLAATDPQDTVTTAKNALLDAEGRLAAANKNEADYGQLKQTVLQRQQDFANAVNENAKATNIAKIDPRNTVALDVANLSGPGGINAQLRSYKGKHTDTAYQSLLAQRRQAQIDLVRDRDAQANAIAESTIDSRDLSSEATEKVREAKVKLDHDNHNSAEYYIDLKNYQDALLAQANTARAIADSAEEASVAPGDAIGEARAAIDSATRALAADIPGQAAYFDDQKKLREAQFALARAQEDYATTLEALGSDQTNPVVQAQNALDAARRKYADDAKLGADPATLAGDQLAVVNDQNAVQKTLFEQQLQDAQTNFSLHRISGAAYIQYLRAQQANLKATGLGTRQLLDEYNEVSQQLLSANQQLTGQFNIGQIKLPTIYQERRQALQNGIDISSTTDNTGGNSFGSATDPLQIAANQQISPLVAAVKQINTQAAVDQLAALQSVLDALGGGATASSAATSPLAAAGGAAPTVVTNHTTINGADFAQVVSYISSVLGTQAIGSRTLTTRKVP